ncbi:MAG: hypothetical protein JWO63_1367 [Frankiales bacterium]|nr:hypothetical protein [Frankiales bacterium]
MYLNGQGVMFSPSDLTAAISCEFALLRQLDVLLGRAEPVASDEDPMLARTAALGAVHEARALERFTERFGRYDAEAGTGVFLVGRPTRSSAESLASAAEQTRGALRSGADVIYQAALVRGRFSGFADFLVRTPATGGAANAADQRPSWAVYDTKLARHAKVGALLQLASYADEVAALGGRVDSQVHLLLGDGQTSSHDLVDLRPVYRERRARLEQILDVHVADRDIVRWNDERFLACGRCEVCQQQVREHRDLLMVANLRISQRRLLREAGIETIDQLATSSEAVAGVRSRTLTTLRAQAALQVRQDPPAVAPATEPSVRTRPSAQVLFEVHTPTALAVLPAPDPGDIFFDFEGDPLWVGADASVSGLEYLFGVVEADGDADSDSAGDSDGDLDRPARAGGAPRFRAFWAHDREQERQALIDFLDYVVKRRAIHPNLHIYHYAPYEKSALLRLAGRHGVGEDVVDELLRAGVLVDLYAVVRNAIRVSQPSYSLKKLEPLYMGAELRESDVKNAADSIVAYAEYCDLRDSGAVEPAAKVLDGIADYNNYDCLSTYRLRDWLLERAAEHDVTLAGSPAESAANGADDTDHREWLAEALLAAVGHPAREARTSEQQAVALLAASLGYHRREDKPFWWAHFDRLINPVDEWADTGDVLGVEAAEVLVAWSKEGRQRSFRRTVRLSGRLGVGSQLGPGDKVYALYDAASVPVGLSAEPGHRGVSKNVEILARGVDELGRDELIMLEVGPSAAEPWPERPMALAPGPPVPTANQQRAITELAEGVLAGLESGQTARQALSGQSALRLLACLPPLGDEAAELPAVTDSDYVAAVASAIRALDRSYLAVQGPPGSGKTYVGSHVVAALVASGWRVGVVAQSHKVIENMLGAIARAGVPATQIGKRGEPPAMSPPLWTGLGDKDAALLDFVATGGAGCVIGGTAWDFTNLKRVAPASLDLLVIDEAGQFSLANTVAVSTAAHRLLLLGDPQQLPQVSQGTHPEACDSSALAWTMGGHRVMPAERGYFLERTWRMHPELTRAVSRLAYEDRLRSQDVVTAARSLAGVEPGVRVLEVDHADNSVESPEEALAVIAEVQRLLGRGWSAPETGQGPRPLAQHDILVVAPYNAQVALLRRRLDAAGLADVRVGSVDKFQGQEAPVVIVSMTASAPADVPRGMDFLLSRNRVNVAVSRAMWSAVIVRSPRLTDYLPADPIGLARLGAFIGLCAGSIEGSTNLAV